MGFVVKIISHISAELRFIFAKWLGISLLLGLFLCSPNMGWSQSAYSSFDEAGYTQPLVTLLGSLMNSSWYQSSRIGKDFGFQVSLPITLAYLSSEDYFYTTKQPRSNCSFARANNSNVLCDLPDFASYEVPTIFGPSAGDVIFTYYHLQTNGEPGSATIRETTAGDGLNELSLMKLAPFFIPQVGFSMGYTELKLRYIYLPLGVINTSAHFSGVGLQHDLSSYLKEIPFSLSIASSLSFWSLELTPSGYTGALEMSGLATTTGLVVGKQWGLWEVFTEIGWETSGMHLGGRIVDEEDPLDIDEPNLDVSGRNGFRLALNVAVHMGYHPVVGQSFGSQLGQQFNVLIFKKEGEK